MNVINVNNEITILTETDKEATVAAFEIIDEVDINEDITLYGVYSKGTEALVFFFKNEDGYNTYYCKKPYRADCEWNEGDEAKYWARVFFEDPYCKHPGDTTWTHTKFKDIATRNDGRSYEYIYSPCDKPNGELNRIGRWKTTRDDGTDVCFVYYKVDDQLYKCVKSDFEPEGEWYAFVQEEEELPIGLRRDTDFEPPKGYDLIKGFLHMDRIGYIKGPGVNDPMMLALMLQMSVSNGIDFLGFKVNLADTLFIETDVSESSITTVLGNIGRFYGLEKTDNLYLLNLSTLDRSKVFDEVCDQITNECRKNPFLKLICIDSLSGLGLDPGESVKKALCKLDCIATKLHIAILFTLSEPIMVPVEGDVGIEVITGQSFTITTNKDGSSYIDYWDKLCNHFRVKCTRDASTYNCFKVIKTIEPTK